MASSDEAAEAAALANSGPRSSNVGLEGAPGRRQSSKKHYQEIVDELAQETKRITLLDREEQQLKDKFHCSRLLFIFGVTDDRKVQNNVEQEISSWRNKQEGGSEVTGLLLYLGQAAACYLEGPTELLFKAMELVHSLSLEVLPVPAMPLPPSDMRTNTSAKPESQAPPPAPRPAFISAVRVLYFTEMHGVRTSAGWCSYVSSTKPSAGAGGGNLNLDDGVDVFVFGIYQKFMLLCLKVQGSVGAGDETDSDVLQGNYRKLNDQMPTPDEVNLLLGKLGNEHFFSFMEFQQVFMKPFQLVLNSELLWPMPPPLSY